QGFRGRVVYGQSQEYFRLEYDSLPRLSKRGGTALDCCSTIMHASQLRLKLFHQRIFLQVLPSLLSLPYPFPSLTSRRSRLSRQTRPNLFPRPILPAADIPR